MIQLDRYSKLLKIGEGGMAHVYDGIQESLQRQLAIKLLINGLSRAIKARTQFYREKILYRAVW